LRVEGPPFSSPGRGRRKGKRRCEERCPTVKRLVLLCCTKRKNNKKEEGGAPSLLYSREGSPEKKNIEKRRGSPPAGAKEEVCCSPGGGRKGGNQTKDFAFRIECGTSSSGGKKESRGKGEEKGEYRFVVAQNVALANMLPGMLKGCLMPPHRIARCSEETLLRSTSDPEKKTPQRTSGGQKTPSLASRLRDGGIKSIGTKKGEKGRYWL